MKRLSITAVLSVVAASVVTAVTAEEATDGGRVTIPLAQYEGLRKAQERQAVTVVDTLRLLGSFEAHDLALTLAGRSAGSLPGVDVLSSTGGVVLHACDGEGIVSRGEQGAFRLTPLDSRFTVRCRIAASGSDRVEMSTTASVLWVESDVRDGELVLAPAGQDGARSFSVVRRMKAGAEGLQASATGRYHIVLRPDETRFRYEILVHNPNRSRQAFDVTLRSGEHVQQVDAGVPYELQQERYRFELPPGDGTLALSGSLSQSAFTPPVEASVQYCVIDSHPLLRPVVAGEPKRVSPQEAGVTAEYRGAQAFIVSGRERLTWKVTRLEALRTTSFAVSRARHVFFVPAEGPVLGQSEITIDNQGASDLSLPMAAEPTFASLQDEPVLLTKDANGHLWLPIAQGQQNLMVQHRQRYSRLPGMALVSLSLPQLPVPASTGEVELRYPQDWTPLYERFMSDARYFAPDGGLVVLALLLVLWTERVLAGLGLPAVRRLVLAVVLALAAAAWGWAMAAVLVGNIVASVVVIWPWLRAHKLGAGSVVAAVFLGGVGVLMMAIAIPSLMRARVGSAPYTEYDRSTPASPAPALKAELQRQDGAAAYQGLPAKFALPSGAQQTEFTRALMDTETPRSVRVFMVSRTLLGWLQALVVLAALVLLWRSRGPLGTGWRARRAAWRPDPSHSA